MKEHLVTFHSMYHFSVKGWTIQYHTCYVRNNTTLLYCWYHGCEQNKTYKLAF